MDLQFEWEDVEAFVRQPDGSLFSWFERFQCYQQLLHGIVRYFCMHNLLALSLTVNLISDLFSGCKNAHNHNSG
jgi:anoctamin-10